jgi:hypothetical protein
MTKAVHFYTTDPLTPQEPDLTRAAFLDCNTTLSFQAWVSEQQTAYQQNLRDSIQLQRDEPGRKTLVGALVDGPDDVARIEADPHFVAWYAA